jgi:nucleoside-diphosphate-sugar epimerase
VTGLVSAGSRALVGRAVVDDDRVLVTGATGWLGRTALDLLSPLGVALLPIAGSARPLELDGRTIDVRTWDDDEVAGFSPTIVVDCAFLTRDRTSDVPFDEYVAANRLLTRRMLDAARLDSVRMVVTVSSGAAVHPVDALSGGLAANPYGYLKREAELQLAEAVAGGHASAVVARAWSISGAHVQKPANYALGSMIQAAAAGAVHVAARRPVRRRYALADELLALALAAGGAGSATIDSGGELVEMSELAERVVAVVNPGAAITRDPPEGGAPDDYHSDGRDWAARCARWSLSPLGLDAQIELTARGVLGRS